MRQAPWEDVVAALLHLGCQVVLEDEFRVLVARGAAVLARVRKVSPFPVREQRRLLTQLSSSEDEYVAALRGTAAPGAS